MDVYYSEVWINIFEKFRAEKTMLWFCKLSLFPLFLETGFGLNTKVPLPCSPAKMIVKNFHCLNLPGFVFYCKVPGERDWEEDSGYIVTLKFIHIFFKSPRNLGRIYQAFPAELFWDMEHLFCFEQIFIFEAN